MGKQMGLPPSDVYGIDDELTAWCFNRAVQTFGNALENALHEVSKKAKPKQAEQAVQNKLNKWLSSADPQEVRDKTQFRDPAVNG